MNPSVIAAGVTAAALALASCPALAGPLEELAGGGSPDLVAAVAAIDPAAAPAWWLSGGGASHPVGCLLALAACSAVAAAVALSAAAPRREGDGGVLGDARVRSGRDAVRGSCTWDGRHDPKGRGLVYGYSGGSRRGRYLYEPGRFCLVDGSTGSGKTRYMLIPTIDLLTYDGASRGSEPHTIVVTDVKGELLELTGDELARRGYEVLLLDAARPARGQRFNPLRQVLDLYSAGMPDEAEQAADGVAESLVPDDRDGAASHWVASARSLLSAVILLVCLDGSCPDGARTMGTVAAVACRGTEGEGDDPCAPLRSLLRSLPASHPARPRASQFLSSGGNELRSIVSTLKAAIRAYGSAPMAWLTSGSEVDPKRMLSRKTALFVRTMDEGSPYNALATVLLGQLWEAARLSAEAEGGRLARPVTVVGDEWGNLPRVPCLPAVLSLGRSYGFYWIGAVQNLAQLNRYGERDGRPKVLANCGVKVALKLGEEEDRRYFTELVGKTTRHTRGTSSGRAGSGTSASTSYSERADDVVHAWEWTSMAPDRDGAVVVRQAENGAPRSHAGAIRAPLADCASTPTRAHFDLGSREHEAARRRAYRERLEAGAARAGRETAPAWLPEWPEDAGDAGGAGAWDGLCPD